jgi:RNA polymerase sigma-70 factor (family 1)
LDELKNITDHDLALLIKSDGKDAFRELFDRYAPRIYKFAFSYLKNRSDAEEIVQNVFMKIWEKRSSIKASENIKAFIFTITTNKIYDFIRRKNIEHTYHDQAILNQGSNENNSWNSIVYKDVQQTISKLSNKLPSQQQRVFNLSKMEGLTNDEIAFKMGISKRTVENDLYRAVLFLKQKFKNEAFIALLLFCLTFQ